MRWLAMFCFSAAGAVFALEYGAEWILLPLLVLVLILTGAALLQHKRKRMIALVVAVGISFGSFYTLLYDTFVYSAGAAVCGYGANHFSDPVCLSGRAYLWSQMCGVYGCGGSGADESAALRR